MAEEQKRSVAEIERYIREVVSEVKSTAKVDTGFLRRSIRGNWFRNIATFREVFYGAYNDNSKLIQIAKRIMPDDIPWRVIYVDEEGRETEIEGKTRSGRTISRKSISSENVNTSNIKKLIAAIQKRNAAKKINTTAGSGENNNEGA